MIKLVAITPDKLIASMADFYPLINDATQYSIGKFGGVDVIRLIMNGTFQLWGAVGDSLRGIAITEIVNFPQKKVCRFLCCTGHEASDWIGLIEEIEAWAVTVGCKSFQAECRPGWERYLKPFGYEKHHVIMNKELAE